MRHLTLLLLGLFALSTTARAEAPATVAAIAGSLLTVKTKLSAGVGDGLCVYRDGKAVACGYMFEGFKGGFRLKLTHGSNQFRAKETLQLMHQARFAKRDSEEVVESPTDNGPSSPAKWLLTGGGDLVGPQSWYVEPYLAMEYKVAKTTTLGVQGSYVTSSDVGGSVTAPGILLTAHYYVPFSKYRQGPFSGLFGSFGLGAYLVSAKLTTGTTASATSIFARLGGGFRLPLGSGGFFLSPRGGIQFITKTIEGSIDLGLPKFALFGGVEFNFQF